MNGYDAWRTWLPADDLDAYCEVCESDFSSKSIVCDCDICFDHAPVCPDCVSKETEDEHVIF